MSSTRDFKWKYRGQNPLQRLREGEPYFFIRGQDQLSVEAVGAYAELLKRESEKARAADNDALADLMLKQALAVLSMAHSFADWQNDNKQFVKLPGARAGVER